jgi:hypothetical protein
MKKFFYKKSNFKNISSYSVYCLFTFSGASGSLGLSLIYGNNEGVNGQEISESEYEIPAFLNTILIKLFNI